MCAMDEAIDSVWVCPPSFFIHFLLKKRKRGFFFSFSSFVFRLLFVRVCIVVRGGVICVACIIILYSRTDAIHFKRYY